MTDASNTSDTDIKELLQPVVGLFREFLQLANISGAEFRFTVSATKADLAIYLAGLRVVSLMANDGDLVLAPGGGS